MWIKNAKARQTGSRPASLMTATGAYYSSANPRLPSIHMRDSNAAVKLKVHERDALNYLPNADFQLWFMPILKRGAICIAVIPFLVYILYFCGLLTPLMGFALGYLSLFKFFLLSQPAPQIGLYLSSISLNSMPLFLLGGFLVFCYCMRFLNLPTLIYFDGDGLVVGRENYRAKGDVDMTIHKLLNWKNLHYIKIVRPKLARSNRDYVLKFESGNWFSNISLRIGDITKVDERERLISFLQENFKDKVDSEALLAIAPKNARQSYTELWLAELAAPPKRDRLTPLETGATLANGKYKVINQLGVGGQGTVYLAWTGPMVVRAEANQKAPEEVVLKEFVLPVFPDQQVRKAAALRFQSEADLLTKLDHPQIVKLKDLFLEDHRAYLVLEHLSGTNLKDLVAEQGPLPSKEVFNQLIQMCQILSYLHGHTPPVVHRDFTPDNLILVEDGKLKLIDFSVAQSFTSNVTGSVVGKPHYIAPEQFRGKPSHLSDIYSMGATLYYLLTGQDPEPITNIKMAGTSKTDPLLAQIIEKATKMDTTLRYQSADDILADLKIHHKLPHKNAPQNI